MRTSISNEERLRRYSRMSNEMNKEFFTGKTVLVMGLGRFGGGVDVARFTHAAGAKVIITDVAPAEQLSESISQLQDLPGIEFHLGSHDPSDFEQADIVIVNPAVVPNNEFLKLAHRHSKLIISQIGIFFQLCPAPIIGITGANGKSTTAALTARLLRASARRATNHESQVTAYENVWLSGNIGNEPLLTVIGQITPNDLVVLELSSFQLQQLAQIQKAPAVALLTNLIPNHLDRYGTFADYCAAKENIFKFQTLDEDFPAVSIFNAEDRIAREWFEKYKKDAGRICIKFSTDDVPEDIRGSFTLPGRTNLANLAAAITVTRHFGTDDDSIRTCLPQFKALPHRLQLVAQINGVCWYNDSKATTPQAAIAALEAFDRPTIIIAGGYDKNLPFDELAQKIAENAEAAILIGQTANKIANAICSAKMSLRGAKRRSNLNEADTGSVMRNTKVEIADSLPEAVQSASQLAVSGDVVLLSPACASYDMFDNFEQRGHEFARLVRSIECDV